MNYSKIHDNAIVVDAHSDIPLDLLYSRKNGEHSGNLTKKHLPILQAGGVNVVFMEIYTKLHPEGSLKQALLEVGDMYEEINENQNLRLICTKDDFKKIELDNSLNIVFSMEGLEPLGCDLTLLNVFYKLGKKMSLDTYMNHLEYMINIAGEDHVGLGLDFNGYLGDIYVPGIEDSSKMPSITDELCKRGYSEETIYKILGGNFLRILNTVLK
ncbi:MAG: microsomal dipeptidase-like Zn-dependent dipeptidase [Clostridium sp.]|jgi:microsomal dipeptidase-like Zn-dependent dipeptidase